MAFFSASSKSIRSVVTFLTPSFSAFLAPSTLAFRAPPPTAVFLSAAEWVMRLAAAGLAALLSEPLPASGDVDRAMPSLPPALRKGDGVRPTTGGVAVREMGGVGFLMLGLSHDEKKSSSGSPEGVLEASGTSPSTVTSPGNLT